MIDVVDGGVKHADLRGIVVVDVDNRCVKLVAVVDGGVEIVDVDNHRVEHQCGVEAERVVDRGVELVVVDDGRVVLVDVADDGVEDVDQGRVVVVHISDDGVEDADQGRVIVVDIVDDGVEDANQRRVILVHIDNRGVVNIYGVAHDHEDCILACCASLFLDVCELAPIIITLIGAYASAWYIERNRFGYSSECG